MLSISMAVEYSSSDCEGNGRKHRTDTAVGFKERYMCRRSGSANALQHRREPGAKCSIHRIRIAINNFQGRETAAIG
jgi:hypothetical protein